MIKRWVCMIVGHKDERLKQGRAGDNFVKCRRCGREVNVPRDEPTRPPPQPPFVAG
jgi:hypothetical protein